MGKENQVPGGQEAQTPPVQNIDAFEATLKASSELGDVYNPNQHATVVGKDLMGKGWKSSFNSPEVYWEKYKGSFGETENGYKSFEQMYNMASEFNTALNKLDYNFPDDAPGRLNAFKRLGYGTGSTSTIKEEDPAYYTEGQGNYDPVWSNSSLAFSKDKYIDKDGRWQDFGFIDRQYEAGKRLAKATGLEWMASAPTKMGEYLFEDILGMTPPQEEKQKPLMNGIEVKQDYDESGFPVGQPYLRELSNNENKYGKEMASFYGPTAKYGNFLADMGKSFMGEVVEGFVTTPHRLYNRFIEAPVQGVYQNIVFSNGIDSPYFYTDKATGEKKLIDYTGSGISPEDYEDNEDWKALKNGTEYEKITPQEYLSNLEKDRDDYVNAMDAAYESLKMTPSADKSGLNKTANILGQGMGFILPGMASQKLALRAFGGGLEKVAASELAEKALLKKMAASSAMTSTAQMAPILYDEAKNAGLSDGEAYAYMTVGLPAAFASELLLGSKIISDFVINPASRSELRSAINKELASQIKMGGGKLNANSIINSSKSLSKSIMDGAVSFLKSNVESKGIAGGVVRGIQGGINEMSQETLEQSWYETEKMLFDNYIAEDGTVKGKGKFDQGDEFWNSMFESGGGGLLVGAFLGGFRGGNKSKYQDNVISRAVANGDEDVVKQYIDGLHKAGQLGETFIDADGNTMNSAQQASGENKSMNDVNRDAILQRLQYHIELRDQLRLKDPGVMAATEGDVTLHQEAIEIAKSQNGITENIKELKSKASSMEAEGKPIEAINKQIANAEKEHKLKDERLNEILSGKATELKVQDVAIQRHFQADKLTEEQRKKIPNSRGVENINNHVVEYDTKKKVEAIEAAERAKAIPSLLETKSEELFDINIKSHSKQFFSKLGEINELITKNIGAIQDKDLTSVLSTIEEARLGLVQEMESKMSPEQLAEMEATKEIDQEGYEAQLANKAEAIDKSIAENYNTLMGEGFESLRNAKAVDANKATLTESQTEKANAIDAYTKVKYGEDYIDINDQIQSIENKGEAITDIDVENLKGIILGLERRENASVINSKIYPDLKYHENQPVQSKLDQAQVDAIKSNINVLKKKANDLITKAEESKLSRANKDARVKSEDIKMRLVLLAKLNAQLGITSEHTDNANKAMSAGELDIAEKSLLAAEETYYQSKDFKEAAGKVIAEMAISNRLKAGMGYSSTREFNYNSFDKLFNASSFVNELKADEVDFVTMYSINYFNSLRRMPPSTFFGAYKTALESIPKTDNVASYEQEMIVRQMVSFSIGGSNEFTKFLDKKIMPKDSEERMAKYINYSLAIRGFAGTGKTTTMSKIALSIYEQIYGKKANVSILAPSSSLAEKFQKVVAGKVESSTIGNFENAEVGFGLNPSTDIVIVDEASALTDQKIEAIYKQINTHNDVRIKAGKKPIVMWMFGDQSQMASLKETGKFSPFEGRMERTVPASTIYRSDIADISAVQEAIRNSMFFSTKELRLPNTTFDAIQEEGVQYFHGSPTESIQDVFEKSRSEYAGASLYEKIISDILNPLTEKNTNVIVYSPDDRSYVLNKMMSDNRLSTYNQQDIEKFVRHLDEGTGSILGHDVDRIYLAISPQGKETYYNRALLTGATRARKFVSMFTVDPSVKSVEGKVIKTTPETNEVKVEKRTALDKRIDGIVEALPQAKKNTKTQTAGTGTTQTGKPKTAKKKVTDKDVAKTQSKKGKKKPKEPKPQDPPKKGPAQPVTPAPTFNQPGNSSQTVPGSYSAVKYATSKQAYVSTANSNKEGAYDEKSNANDDLIAKAEYLASIYKHIKNPLTSPKLRIVYKAVSKLNEGGKGLKDFMHVMQIYNGDMLIGVMSNPVIDKTGKTVGTDDPDFYSNESKIKDALDKIDRATDLSKEEKIYNTMLVNIRAKGAKSPMGEIGFFRIADILPGKLVDAPKEVPLDILYSNLENKNFYTEGILYQDNEAYRDKDGNPVMAVVMHVSAAKGLPVTKVIVNTPDITETDYKEIFADINQMKKMKVKSATYTADINRSLAFKTAIFNRHLFHKQLASIAFDDKVTGEALLKRLETFWKKAKEMADKDKTIRIKSLTNTTRDGDIIRISGANRDNFTTKIIDVHMPSVYMNMSAGMANIRSTPGAPGSSSKSRMDSSLGKKRPMAKDSSITAEEIRESREAVNEYYDRIFGRDFRKGNLEFKPNVLLDDNEVYGLTENAHVTLEETKEGVKAGVARHEAVHVVMDSMISPESRRAILDDAINSISLEKGISKDMISDDDAHEFIATQNETAYINPTTLWGKFLRWFNSIFSKWGTYNDTVADLLYQIEYGAFKGEPIHSNSQESVARPKKKANRKSKSDKINDPEESQDIRDDSVTTKYSGIEEADNYSINKNVRDYTRQGDKYSNFHSLTKVFGDDTMSNIIARKVGSIIHANSNFNKDIYSLNLNTAGAINATIEHYKKMSSDYGTIPNEPTLANGKIIKDISEITGDDLKYVDNEGDRAAYISLKLSNPEIYYRIVKKNFPKIDIEKTIIQGIEDMTPDANQTDNSVEDAYYENQETTIHDENQEKDYLDYTSQFIHWNLKSLPRKLYTKSADGLMSYSYDANYSFINQRQLHRDLIETANEVGPVNFEAIFPVKLLERAWSTVRVNPDGSQVFSESGNDLITFYYEYLSNHATIHQANADGSYRMEEIDLHDLTSDLLTRIDEDSVRQTIENMFSHSLLGNNIHQIAANFPEVQASIVAKAQKSIELTNALMSTFRSISPKKNIKWVFGRKGGVKLYIPTNTDVSSIKNEFTKHLDNTIFEISGDVRAEVKRKINDGKLVVTPTSIKNFVTGKEIISISKKGKTLSFKINDKAGYDDINAIVKTLGLKLRKQTITMYMSDKNLSHPKSELAEILGVFTLSTKIAADSKFSEPGILDVYYERNQAKDEDLDSALAGDKSVSERIEIAADMAERGEMTRRPSNFFRLKEKLAEAESISRGEGFNRKYYNVKGTAEFTDTFTNTLHRLFGYSNSATSASSRIKDNPQYIASANPDYISQNGKIYNAFGDHLVNENGEGSNAKVIDMYITDGAQDGRRGKSFDEINDLDYAKVVIDGSFIESVIGSTLKDQPEEIVHVFQPLTDRSKVPVFKTSLGKDRNDKLLYSKEGEVKIGYKLVAEHFNRIFNHYNSNKNNSIDRWVQALVTSPAKIPADRLKIDVWKGDPKKFVDFIYLLNKELAEQGTLEAHIKHIQKTSGFVNNHDVVYVGGVPTPGQATTFYGHQTFNYIQFNRWKKMVAEYSANKDENVLRKHIMSLIGKQKTDRGQYKQMYDYLNSIGYEIPDKVLENLPKGQKQFFNYEMVEIDGKEVKKFSGYNPFYEAFIYSSIIHGHYLNELIMGEPTYFDSIKNLFARGSGPSAPGKSGSLMISNAGLRPNLKMAVMPLRDVFETKSYSEVEGNPIVNPFDGYTIMNPVTHALAQISDGMEMGQMGNSMIKPQYFFQGVYLKTGTMPLVGSLVDSSDFYNDMFRKMNGPRINSLYDELRASGLKFSEAIRRIAIEINMDPSIHDDIVTDIVADTSSVKSGANHLNGFGDEAWANQDLLQEHFQIQLNPSQNINDTDLAGSTQVLSAIGVGPQNTQRAQDLNNIQATLSDMYMNSLRATIAEGSGDMKEKLTEFLRKIGKSGSDQMGDISRFVDELNNDNISLDIPTVRFKLFQFLNNKITRNAIKPKSNGVRMNQAPGTGIQIYDTERGPMTKADALKAGYSLEGKGRDLKPMKWEGGKVHHAEVIMPFSYVSQFGLSPDMNINEMREFLASDPAKLQAFENAITVILTRTPAGSTSAGFIGKAIGFFNDIGNVVFIPEEHNILTGGDFDIDQLSDFFPYIDQDGSMPLEGYDGLRNQLILEMIGYYTDPANREIITTPTDLSNMKKISDNADTLKGYSFYVGDPTTQMYFHNIVMDGKAMTGRFANGNKAYQFLMQGAAINLAKGNGPVTAGWNLDMNGKNKEGKYILSVYNNSIDASTTNPKNLILGSLKASPELGNVINAGIASGEAEQDIYTSLLTPVVEEIVAKLRRSTRMNSKSRNKYGKPYTIFDAINDVRNEVEFEEHPVMAEFIDLKEQVASTKRISKAKKQKLQDRLAEVEAFLEKDMPGFEASKSENLVRLNEFENKTYLGEALRRLNGIVGINANGLKVTDFDFNAYLANAELFLNQPIEDFLAGKPISDDKWYLTKNKYLSGTANEPGSEMANFIAMETRIRKLIDIKSVVGNLTHIKAYMANAVQTRDWNRIVYIQDSELFNDVQDQFLSAIKQDKFHYDGNFYGFKNEMWRFMDALFFDKYYTNKDFDSMTGFTATGKINLSTPGGRYMFGQEFPAYLKKTIERERANGNKAFIENAFIDRLNVTHLDHLPEDDKSVFVELVGFDQLTPEQFADMRLDFMKLDDYEEGLIEKFWLYNKMRFGFDFKSGSLGEAMGVNKFDEAYSDFLRSFSNTTAEYSENPIAIYTYGDGTMVPVVEMFAPFINSVGAYNNDLLNSKDKNVPWTSFNQPKIWKEHIREFGYTIIHDHDQVRPYKQAYIDRFNPYDVKKAAVTEEQVLKNLPYSKYKDWRIGQTIEVSYLSKVHFEPATRSNWEAGLVAMPDGSTGVIVHVTPLGKSGTIVKIQPVDIYNKDHIKRSKGEDIDVLQERSKKNLDKYMTIKTKQEFADYIANNGTSAYMRELFTAMNSLHDRSVARVGDVLFKTKLNDYNLMADYLKDGSETAAYYNKVTRDITINKEAINGSGFRVEKLFAHEMVHDYTLSALSKDETSLNRHEKVFRTKMDSLFESAKSWASENGYDVDKTYGLTDVAEFASEAFANSAFQKMLMQIPAVEDIKTESNLFEKFVSLLGDFLSSMTGISIDNSTLSQVINVTGDYMSNTEYFESVYNKDPKLRPNGRVNARNSEEYQDEVDNIVNSLKGNLTKVC